jgi:hypothetical protein
MTTRHDALVLDDAQPQSPMMHVTSQLYPHEWKIIARNCVYRRRLPMASLLVPCGRKASLEDRFHQMLLAAAERQRYVHVWGHAADIHRLNLWGA